MRGLRVQRLRITERRMGAYGEGEMLARARHALQMAMLIVQSQMFDRSDPDNFTNARMEIVDELDRAVELLGNRRAAGPPAPARVDRGAGLDGVRPTTRTCRDRVSRWVLHVFLLNEQRQAIYVGVSDHWMSHYARPQEPAP
jgi:hypothetical protein